MNLNFILTIVWFLGLQPTMKIAFNYLLETTFAAAHVTKGFLGRQRDRYNMLPVSYNFEAKEIPIHMSTFRI